ncbi:hypothetical protein CR513_34481, partial [Mucuna pruriens]
MLLAIIAQFVLHLEHMDAKITFYMETVFLKHLEGFEDKDKFAFKNLCITLNSHNTNGTSILTILSQELDSGEYIYLFYVDDMLIACKNMVEIEKLKKLLNLGNRKGAIYYFLGKFNKYVMVWTHSNIVYAERSKKTTLDGCKRDFKIFERVCWYKFEIWKRYSNFKWTIKLCRCRFCWRS